MPTFTGIHNQAAVTLVIGVTTMKGLSPDNPIRVNLPVEQSTVTKPGPGSDRGSTSLSVDRSGTIEVDFLPTSPSMSILSGLKEAQANGLLFPVYLVDAVGRAYTGSGCSIAGMGVVTTGGSVEQAQTVIFNAEKLIEVY